VKSIYIIDIFILIINKIYYHCSFIDSSSAVYLRFMLILINIMLYMYIQNSYNVIINTCKNGDIK